MQDDDDVEDEEDSDSDVMEVEAEDPLSGGGAAGAEKKSTPNVVTIDDVKTLQRLANNAKKQVRKENITVTNLFERDFTLLLFFHQYDMRHQ